MRFGYICWLDAKHCQLKTDLHEIHFPRENIIVLVFLCLIPSKKSSREKEQQK